MLPLPPPPPRATPQLLSAPQSPSRAPATPLLSTPSTPSQVQRQSRLSRILMLNAMNQQLLTPSTPTFDITKSSKPPVLLHHPRRTSPVIWCAAILCLIFSLVLIIFGIVTLIIFLVIRPKTPFFDTPNATLSSIYFDSPEYFNGDFTFVANFSNPNGKIDVRFEYLEIELYYSDRLIATHALQPFIQRRKETRLETVHLISSLVFLPQNLGVELRNQVQSNRVTYNIRGTFKVKVSIGLIHFSYWLHGRCQLEMTGPPTGFLIARRCKTKR